LRDIADAVGGFKVDFNNDTIQLSKDGYEYGSNAVGKLAFTEKMSKDFSEYCRRIPEFTQESLSSEEFVENFIFYYYTGKGDVNSSSYHDGYFDWSEDSVKQDYKLLFGADMPEYHKSYGKSVIYNNGTYEIAASNFGDESYNLIDIEADNDTITAVYRISDFENNDYGSVTLKAVAADNENGYVLISKVKN
jgi:hypothetical protein